MNEISLLIFSGTLGVGASLLVGWGEFLLHYSQEGYGKNTSYEYMKEIPNYKLTKGHFLAVLSCPFYLIGFWHLYKMLEPAGTFLPLLITLVGSYGIIIGAIWIGSRALIAKIVQQPENLALINFYHTFYESLLSIVRLTTALTSIGFVYLVWQGETLYPTWMAFFNPLALLITIFLIYLMMPRIGKYIVPMALNVAYCIFFSFSTLIIYSQGG